MRPGKLFLFAVLIRVLFLILALLADNLSPDYDNSMMAEVPSSASLQNNNNESDDSYTNTRVFTILDPLMRWDAVHFRHIAKFGYTHEHMCAFFPQTPNIFKAFGLIDGDVYKNKSNNNKNNKINKYFETFPSPPPIVNELLFVTFHIFCFAFATLFLRSILLSLTDRVNKSNRQNNLSQSGMMRPSLLVWLINPASIFFTAAYTETYFALVAFAGMFCIEKLHYYSGYKSYSEFGNNNNNVLENTNDKNQESSTLPVRISEKDLTDEQLRGRSPSPMSPTAAARKKLTQKGRRVSIEEREENNNESDDSSSKSSSSNKNNNQQEKDKTSSEVISFARSFTWAVAAGMCFFVATTLRSNGILLAGFLIHFAVCRLWFVDHFVKIFRRFGLLTGIEEENTHAIKKNEKSSSSGANEKRRKSSLAPIQKLVLSFICVGLAYMVTIPYQNHINMCHKTFCQDNEKYHQVSKIPRDTDLVCHSQKGVSGFYSGIQRKYWKVGLFEYFTPNNIPNFFIAAPTFLFVLIGLYFRIFFSNNSASSQTKKNLIRSKISETLSSIISWISSLEGCHIVYLLAQLTFAFLTMNVQVVTRFVAASPALYYLYGELLWKCTILTECSTGKLIEPHVFESFENDDRKLQSVRRFAKILKPLCCGFVLVWAAVGTAMFPNFMPWT